MPEYAENKKRKITNEEELANVIGFFSDMSPLLFNRKIPEALQLREESYVRLKRQKVGNCTIANNQAMSIAATIAAFEPLLGREGATEFAMATKVGRAVNSHS